MFLTQLAAIALHHAGETDPRLPETAWKKHLLALTAGAHPVAGPDGARRAHPRGSETGVNRQPLAVGNKCMGVYLLRCLSHRER